jgi:DNA-directed RNA polymerase specialized sigma24 family protein
MSLPRKPESASFRAEYAKITDFCAVLEREIKPFYLFAFLLTANHKEAEQCFSSALEKDCKENSVFKGRIESWIKRSILKKAIAMAFSRSANTEEPRDHWFDGKEQLRANSMVIAVTSLAGLERFVFVMSVLEKYSLRDCSLLLKCTLATVEQSRVDALCKLAQSNPLFAADPTGPSGRRELA